MRGRGEAGTVQELAVLGLIAGIVLLVVCSDKAVDHSLKIASAWA